MKYAMKVLGIGIAVLLSCVSFTMAADRDVCITCHSSDMEGISPELHEMYMQWKSSPHYRARVGCYDCHGGNIQGAGKDEIHQGRKNLKDATIAVEMCGNCHQGQKEAFQQSRHFKAIQDKQNAPSCVTCHGSRKASKLDPLDVPGKCAQCHNDKNANHPDIPKRASEIFVLYEQIKAGIANTTQQLIKAEVEGQDISEKRRSLGSIQMIVDDLSVSWHGFDLAGVKSTLQPLPVSLYMASTDEGYGKPLFRWVKIVGLVIVIIIGLFWIVDRFKNNKEGHRA